MWGTIWVCLLFMLQSLFNVIENKDFCIIRFRSFYSDTVTLKFVMYMYISPERS